jgi:hypothetical protein
MPTRRLLWWGAVGGLIAGLAWGASGVVAFLSGAEEGFGSEGIFHDLGESLHAIAEGGMLLWLVGSHVRQAPSYGRLGTAGFVVSFVATTLQVVVTIGEAASLAFPDTLYGIGFIVGWFGWLVGFTLLGIATFRTKILPRWCGLLLIAFFPLIVFLGTTSYGVGGVLVGLLWLALGYALRSWGDVPAEQPSRVS